jgi:hypothetical protein
MVSYKYLSLSRNIISVTKTYLKTYLQHYWINSKQLKKMYIVINQYPKPYSLAMGLFVRLRPCCYNVVAF